MTGEKVPTYMILGKYMQQGVKNMKDSPARLDTIKQDVQAAGGKVQAFYINYGSV